MLRAHSRTGFTLLEMLVVLVMVSLFALLLFHSLQFLNHARQSAARHSLDQRITVLQENWLRNVIGGLVVEPYPLPPQFWGDPTGFQGQTLQALTQPTGMPTLVELRLQTRSDGVRLLYAESHWQGRPPWVLAYWPNARSAAFSYLDARGANYNNWPLPAPPNSFLPPPELPSRVLLRVAQADAPWAWVIEIWARQTPSMEPVDMPSSDDWAEE